MNYKKMSNDELSACKYPNLMAEIIESGYSTSTLADFMGIGSKKDGRYRPEGDPEVWNKINGSEELLASHALGLCKYYNCDYDYMFSHTLNVISGKPAAYWHWYEENKLKDAEYNKKMKINEIYHTLDEKPYLIDFMKEVIKYIDSAEDSIAEIRKLTNILNEGRSKR